MIWRGRKAALDTIAEQEATIRDLRAKLKVLTTPPKATPAKDKAK